MGLADNIQVGMLTNENVEAVKILFPGKNRTQMLQMLTEVSVEGVVPMAMLGLFKERFKSKALSTFQEQVNVVKIAQKRAGRLEAESVLSSPKPPRPSEERGEE